MRRLSLGLTRERELAGARYMDDPKLLGAYLLFYWPVSYAQARQVLGELPNRPRTVLDLGSGPGPVAFAAMDAGAAEVTAADRSRPALELALKLAAEAGEALSTRNWDPQAKKGLPEGQFDVITMGHVLNELFGQDDAALARRADLLEEALGEAQARWLAGGDRTRPARHLAEPAQGPRPDGGPEGLRGAQRRACSAATVRRW